MCDIHSSSCLLVHTLCFAFDFMIKISVIWGTIIHVFIFVRKMEKIKIMNKSLKIPQPISADAFFNGRLFKSDIVRSIVNIYQCTVFECCK